MASTDDIASIYLHSVPFDAANGYPSCLAASNNGLDMFVPLGNTTPYVIVPFNDAFDQNRTFAFTVTVTGPFLRAPVDFSRDGQSDFPIVRNTGGGPSGAVSWFTANSFFPTSTADSWGIASDSFVPADYDGDGKADVAIWRAGAPGSAGFWIKRSSDGAVTFVPFGQTGDEPRVVGDYDGDGTADVAVYRSGASPGTSSTWFYKRSIDGAIVGEIWGQQGDTPVPADYDGDGRMDLGVRRSTASGGAFLLNRTSAGPVIFFLGAASDPTVAGDFDGDGKGDLVFIRAVSGAIVWTVRQSSDGGIYSQNFGLAASDVPVPGDYDRDGKTDFAIWRSGVFWIAKSTGGVTTRNWVRTATTPSPASR